MEKVTLNEINLEDEKNQNENESVLIKLRRFNIQSLTEKNKVPILFALFGMLLVGLGVFLYKNTDIFEGDRIEVVEKPLQEQEKSSDITVEISGAVTKPGVYILKNGSRINDLMIASEGLSAKADRNWVEKNINRAAKLNDGQKLYIKSEDEQTVNTTANIKEVDQTISPVLGVENQNLVDINTASFEELDKLPGIGQVYGQKIIEQRPYSIADELLTRKVLPKSTYEKIKDLIRVY